MNNKSFRANRLLTSKPSRTTLIGGERRGLKSELNLQVFPSAATDVCSFLDSSLVDKACDVVNADVLKVDSIVDNTS